MPVVEHDQLEEMRTLLRNWGSSFLLRSYDAAVDDYLAITDEDLKVEYLDGELIVHSPATLTHEGVGTFLIILLGDFVGRHKLGQVWGPNAVMQLGPKRYFSPDLSYLSNAHRSRIQNERVVGPMDLAVEILSKSTRRYDRGDKLTAYQEGGVPEIWLVDPDEQRFEAYVRRGAAYERSELTAGRWSPPMLPGVSLDVAWLWRAELPSLDECRAPARG